MRDRSLGLLPLLNILWEALERLVIAFLGWVGCPPRTVLRLGFGILLWLIRLVLIIHMHSVIGREHLIRVRSPNKRLRNFRLMLRS
jgi:hypothetical protein